MDDETNPLNSLVDEYMNSLLNAQAKQQANVMEFGDEVEGLFDALTPAQMRTLDALLASVALSERAAGYYRGVLRMMLHYKHGESFWGINDLNFEELSKGLLNG